MANSNWWDFWCNIGESSGVIKRPNQMGGIFSAILVNCVGYVGGPLKLVNKVR